MPRRSVTAPNPVTGRTPVASAWLTAAEAAAYAKVNAVTLRRAVKAGYLPAFRVNGGRHVRFRIEGRGSLACAARANAAARGQVTKLPEI